MSTDLSFARLREINVERCESPVGFAHKLEDWTVNDWLVALGGEVGEAMNVSKKMRRLVTSPSACRPSEKDEDELLAKLASELADVAIYLDLCAARLGIDLAEVVIATFNKKSESMGCPIKL